MTTAPSIESLRAEIKALRAANARLKARLDTGTRTASDPAYVDGMENHVLTQRLIQYEAEIAKLRARLDPVLPDTHGPQKVVRGIDWKSGEEFDDPFGTLVGHIVIGVRSDRTRPWVATYLTDADGAAESRKAMAHASPPSTQYTVHSVARRALTDTGETET